MVIRLTRAQQRVVAALRGQTYPMMGHEIATLAMSNRLSPTLDSLRARGIVAKVVRERTYTNGESRSVMGYILTRFGEEIANG